MSYRATFLFATPTLAEGVGRLVDFGGTLDAYNYTPGPPVAADVRALRNDWKAVGEYLTEALQRHKASDNA